MMVTRVTETCWWRTMCEWNICWFIIPKSVIL